MCGNGALIGMIVTTIPILQIAIQQAQMMEFIGLSDRAGQLAESLNVGQKKRLEMARALAAHPYLLLLDEVLAGLNPSEISQMIEIVRQIRQRGITIIMIEHRLKELFRIADRIIALNYGQKIADGQAAEVMESPEVKNAYLGSE